MLINFVAAAVLAVLPAYAPADGVDAASIDAVVRAYRDATHVPGVAVAITRGQEVVHTAGYGRTAQGDPVSDRTGMAIASVSKSITALAVMQLVEGGRVRLDEPVRTYLPEFTMADPRAERITVRHLLNQSSGMSDTTFRSFSGPRVYTLREAVAQMRTARLAADPGERFEYHNPNFQVAARLIEVVTGETYDGYLQQHVFGPLGMTDSRSLNTADDLPDGNRGHILVAGRPLTLPEPPAFGAGSGSVISTAHDMSKWLIAQTAAGAGAQPGPGTPPREQGTPPSSQGTPPTGQGTPPGNQGTPPSHQSAPVLSPAGFAEMHRKQARNYGLGWFVDTTESGAPIISHDGTLLTFTAYQALLPASGYGIAVMVNARTGYADADVLGDMLVDLLEGRRVEPPDTSAVWIDVVLMALIIGPVVLAVRGVRRADRRRHPLRMLPYLAPVVVLVTLHRIAGFLYRGRDISWLQTVYLYPTFVLLLTVTAAACLVVVAARTVVLVKRGRARTPVPAVG